MDRPSTSPGGDRVENRHFWTPFGTAEGPVAYALSFVAIGALVVLLALLFLQAWMTFAVCLAAVGLAFLLWKSHERRHAR